MGNLQVVKATVNDVIQLQQIARDTFSETFSDVNTGENMKNYLNESFSTAKLTEELNNESSQFYFAVSDGEVIGYLKINTGEAQNEIKDSHALEIERIYVLKAYHGKKAGQLLYEKALNVATGMNASYVWLGVWEENARAISFYTKNEFEPFDRHIFKLGCDEQIDIMMKKTLAF